MRKKNELMGRVPYTPSEDRPAIEEMMADPIESKIQWRKGRGFDSPDIQRGDIEFYSDPRIGVSEELLAELKTPEGNRQAVETILNTWITEHLALDRMFQSEILESDRMGGQLHTIQDMYDKKRPNEQVIIGLFSAKKRLTNLPGISFTQVNMTQGPQQVNNQANGIPKPKGEI